MDPLVLAFQPSGQGTPYIIDTGDLPRTEEVFLHEPDRVFDRSLAFRIRFITHPEPDILFSTEIFKGPGLDDFTIGFTGDKHGVLVDDQFFRTPSKPAETMIDRLTGFFRVILVILCINT